MKVLNDGKVAVGGTHISNSKVQVNITEGDNNGFKIYDTGWNESKFKITTDEFNTYLSGWAYYPQHFMAFTGDAGVNIGEKPSLTTHSGGLLNIFPVNTRESNNCGIYIRATYNSSIGLYSSADSNTKLTFASGLTSGYYNFYVRGNGEAYTQGILITSDSLLKQDIKPLTGSLEKIMNMRGVTYRYKDRANSINPTEESFSYQTSTSENRKKSSAINGVPKLDPAILKRIEEEDKNLNHIGLLAQEVEKIAPEVVRTSIDGTKAIAYTELIALLIEGIKEQQTQIDNLSTQLKASLAPVKSAASMPDGKTGILTGNLLATLYQNTPNPFSQSTQIKYYLSKEISQALLCIYDINGKQLRQITLYERGESSLTLHGSELAAGIYLYGLIADGQQVDVKRMVLTE